MSNRKLISPSIVTGIADAIRTKKGTTATIKVSELADEIASIPTGGGMADSTKELVNVVSGVTPTDEISLNNGIASGVVDAPSVQSWADTRTTADGGTIKDGVAYIKALRGKSVKYNQLVRTGTTPKSVNRGTYTYDSSTGIYDVTATAARTSIFWDAENTKSGRKYLAVIDVLVESTTSINISNYSNITTPSANAVTQGSWTRVASIVTFNTDTTGNNFGFQIPASNTSNFKCKKPILIDMTACGIDTLTTADAIAQYFGYASAAVMPMLPYQADTIVLNSKQKSVSSYGRNLLQTNEVSGAISGGALFTNLRNVFNGLTYKANTQYVFSCVPTTIGGGSLFFRFRYTDGTETAGYPWIFNNNSITEGTPFSLVSESGKTISGVVVSYGASSSNNSTISQIMLEEGNTAHDYEPHRAADTLTLPTLTAFPHGLCGVGTAYDEVSLAEGKATKRIGCVKLKEKDYARLQYSSSFYYFRAVISDGLPNTTASNMPNLMTRGYVNVKQGTGFLTDKSITHFANGMDTSKGVLLIRDDTYEDAASFKAHFTDDDVLFYELREDAESTFTPCRAYYKASNNGQEVATADTATAPFTAEIGYKEPTATELVNALNG